MGTDDDKHGDHEGGEGEGEDEDEDEDNDLKMNRDASETEKMMFSKSDNRSK